MQPPYDKEDPAPLEGDSRVRAISTTDGTDKPASTEAQDPASLDVASANGGRVAVEAKKPACGADRDEKRVHNAIAIWSATTPAADTYVAVYLAARGIRMVPPACLRFHPELNHKNGGRWPAMVALIQCASDGEPMGVHRTFLAPDGSGKAPATPQKMMLGYAKGGVARLAEPQEGMPLLIGEGVETCLSAMQATGWPAWAALSAGNFVNLDLPQSVRDLLILADSDDGGAGIKGA
jgi:phage/plasmid primase-like uncharacterized protein